MARIDTHVQNVLNRSFAWLRQVQRGSGAKVAKATVRVIDPSDPLHAYPTAFDLRIHKLFQKVATYEINNAESVQRLITFFKVMSIGTLVAIFTIVGLGAAGLLGAVASIGRSDTIPLIDWSQLHPILS